MKSIKMKVVILLITLWSAMASATEREGHGGRAIVCRNEAGIIQSAQLLDLWEAANLPRKDNGFNPLEITRKPAPVDEQVLDARARIESVNEHAHKTISQAVDSVKSDIQVMNVQMRRIDDSNDFAYPKDCHSEQLANYTNDYGIIVNKEIWDMLEPTDQAAFILHEAVYKTERELLKENNSDHARKVVGYLFSASPLTLEVLGDLALICKQILIRVTPPTASYKTWTGKRKTRTSSLNFAVWLFWVDGQKVAKSSEFDGRIRENPVSICTHPNRLVGFSYITDVYGGGGKFRFDAVDVKSGAVFPANDANEFEFEEGFLYKGTFWFKFKP